jgi:hypothetical protein
VYLGVYTRLLNKAMEMLKKRVVDGMTQPLSHLPRAISAIYECGRMGRVAYDALVKALWKHDQRPRTQAGIGDMTLAMCDAKAAIDALVPMVFGTLNRYVGHRGMNDTDYSMHDLVPAGAQAPTPDVVSETGGCIMMEIDPGQVPTIC